MARVDIYVYAEGTMYSLAILCKISILLSFQELYRKQIKEGVVRHLLEYYVLELFTSFIATYDSRRDYILRQNSAERRTHAL